MSFTVDIPHIDQSNLSAKVQAAISAGATVARHYSDPNLDTVTFATQAAATAFATGISGAETVSEPTSAQLIIDHTTFLTTASVGAIVASLSQPYGGDTAYTVVGTPPVSLTLAGRTLTASGAVVANTIYPLRIRAASSDGRRAIEETFSMTARAITIPLAYTLPTLTKLTAFTDITGFSGSGYAVQSSGNRGANGAPSLKLTENGGSGSITVNKTNVVASTVDPATLGTIAWYTESENPYWEHNSSQPSFVRGGTVYAAPSELLVLQSPRPGRWNARHISEFTNAGTALSTVGAGTALDARIQEGSSGPHNSAMHFDRLYANAQGRPTWVPTWDDGLGGQYTYLLPLLQKYGFNASFAPIKNRVGQSGSMTLAQVQALYDAGNDIICDGRDDDNSPVTATSLSDAMANLNSVRTWTQSNGWSRGANHIVWPFGVFETSARNNIQVNVTAGSPVVTMSGTGANVTTNLLPGMSVGAYAGVFPSGTTVVSVDSISQLTLSQNALVTNNTAVYGLRVQFTDDVNAPFFGSKILDACKSAGYLTGRTVGSPNPPSGNQMHTRFGMAGQELCYPSYSFISTSVTSDITNAIDLAIMRGTTFATFSHDVAAAGSTTTGNTVAADKWDTILAYARAKVDAGLLDVCTVSQWHARDLANPAIPPV